MTDTRPQETSPIALDSRASLGKFRGPPVQYCPVCNGDGKRVVDRKPVACGYCAGCGVIPASPYLYQRLWRARSS